MNNNNPRISVIIPIWGVEKYIERCARSLFEQTIDDIEFIFIDDCSPDNSIGILKDLLLKYPKRQACTRIMKMPQNSGLAAVRKFGVGQATGEYVIACDSDDYVDKCMYEDMYNLAKKGNYDLVQCDIAVVDDEKMIYTLTSKRETLSSDQLKKDIICGNISNSLCNKLVKREIYLNNGVEFPTVGMDEDNAMSVQLAFFCDNLAYIRKPYYKAYQNTNSISRKIGEDQVLKRYRESLVNSELLVRFLIAHDYSENDLAVIKAKIRPKNALFPILKNYHNIKLWRNTYPEINNKIVFNGQLPKKDRLKSLLALLYIYPMFKKFFE